MGGEREREMPRADRGKSRLCVNLHLEEVLDLNGRRFCPEAHHLTYHSPTGMDGGIQL